MPVDGAGDVKAEEKAEVEAKAEAEAEQKAEQVTEVPEAEKEVAQVDLDKVEAEEGVDVFVPDVE